MIFNNAPLVTAVLFCAQSFAAPPIVLPLEEPSALEARDLQWGTQTTFKVAKASFSVWATVFTVGVARPTALGGGGWAPRPSQGASQIAPAPAPSPSPSPWAAAIPAPSPAPSQAQPLPAAPSAAAPASPLPQPAQPAPPAPAQPAIPAPQAKKASLSVTTADLTFCRKWPDNISSDSSGLRLISAASNAEVTCWSKPSMDGDNGKVENDAVWLRTSIGCFVNEKSLQGREDFQAQLAPCADTGSHWVGTLQTQYKREDCYACTSQDCPSQNLGSGPYLDIDCYADGDVVAGNGTWYKQVDQQCYYPGAIFATSGWLGTKGNKCK